VDGKATPTQKVCKHIFLKNNNNNFFEYNTAHFCNI
jgi:hypothetical protein